MCVYVKIEVSFANNSKLHLFSCIPNNVISIFTGYPWIKTKDAAMRNCTWTEETEIWTRIGYDDNLQVCMY